MGINSSTLFFASIGGILPALFWLWFWLKEDKKHPEPRSSILLAFITGMLVVILCIPLQQYVNGTFKAQYTILFLWVIIEELGKYFGARVTVLGKKNADEPIDMVIYMITVALGFGAMENALFLLKPLVDGSTIDTLNLGNLRFIGASLLHIVSSSAIGVALAMGFYKSRLVKKIYLAIGVILAILLHSIFNLLIMNSDGGGMFLIFAGVWLIIFALLLIFEKIKRIHP